MIALAVILGALALAAALLACLGAWVALRHVHGISGRFARHLTAHALDTEDQPARRHAARDDAPTIPPDDTPTTSLEVAPPTTARRPTPLPRPGKMQEHPR
jgi:hypothetical protein